MNQILITIVLLVLGVSNALSQGSLSADVIAKIDKTAADALASTGVPAASVAVVKDGHVVYTNAYGSARMEPAVRAVPSMRFSIGSISKQFTATALLMLQEEGKLSLDDKVSRFLPDLTRSNEVTIRNLLTHTSGYQDYWPQDYVMPGMLKPVDSEFIVSQWARKPLDFDPGTKWQYSNTNYVIAGVIAEKVAKKPLFDFLKERIFVPLGMNSVVNIDDGPLPSSDATGYYRFALGPLHPAPKEGRGWLFAAGELAMTAEDLAKWDVSLIDGKLLKPDSYLQLTRDTLLKSGLDTRYGLGVSVGRQLGRRIISHDGEVSGFTAENTIFPDDRVAIVVLTNQDAANAAGAITQGIAPLLFDIKLDPAAADKTAQARKIFEGLQQGKIDRSLFTENANFYFSEQALKDFASSLGPLGAVQSFVQTGGGLRGGMQSRFYQVKLEKKTLQAWTYELPDGKLEQFQVAEP
ncbi:MAG: beta-lactamase family protein [Acidobacteria bacterium]|nr:beta-lactamase family protein [Acidobacteriota bacterium]